MMSGSKTPQKPAPFSLRLTFEEKEYLKRKAGTRPLGAYIREHLLGDKALPRKYKRRKAGPDHEILSQLLGALGGSRLAANMNQIAKSAHIGTLPLTADQIEELTGACDDIRAMRHALITALGIKPS